MSDQLPAERSASDFAVCELASSELSELIESNIGATGMSAWDLDAIKIPAGGGISFEVPTLEGDTSEKELEGVIIFYRDTRAYWSSTFEQSGGGSAPDCVSQDGATGIGDPGGDCNKCIKAQFGSDENGGRGQACKQMKKLFVLPPDRLLPFVVDLPPTSLNVVKQFMFRLLSQRVAYHTCLTKFELEKATNQDGIGFSRIKLSMARKLTDEELAPVQVYREQILPMLASAPVTFEEEPIERKVEVEVEEESFDTTEE